MFTKEEALSQISELVERFSLQIDSYKKNDYNETQTRQDFINPFFKALGWDIDNSQGNAEAYREVIHEDKLKIGSATKAPDYSFRLAGGKRLFFVEAKKPSVSVKEDIAPAYQLRRYGWSAKLPISLITDFEEFAVYDCTKKPDLTDKASTARIKYITYQHYLDEFDFIWNTFSKVSVLKGSFDKFIVSDKNKRGTATVDREFLISLDEWRVLLAQNVALRNQNYSEDEINFVVQQTLDRIIFLRIAEDRGVEVYGELKEILSKSKEEGAYFKGLFDLFKEADSKYNSGLFDFKKDKLTINLSLDNKVIKTIVSELYYPVSPYEFSVLGVEILGSAYEQFLGKKIKLNAGHKIIIEEKPEVRKAGGVYYTPQYIVDYIVQNTVGKLTEKKTPEQIALVKIVDPACGSGSFLIGAYKYLLEWHLNYYMPEFIKLSNTASDTTVNTRSRETAIKERNKLPLTPEGHLTSTLKKKILLNNIYGVDIDTQAVEVTKLSLLLKCMEGETTSSINAIMHFGERLLPTLDDNIKSGNSLIGMDFYDLQIDYGEVRKTNPFNWENAFSEIFKKGGFDIVIGNPPYVLITNDLFNEKEITYINNYNVAQYKVDLFHLFIEKGLKLLCNRGILGYILPSTWMTQQFTEKLRRHVLERASIIEVFHFEFKVFEQADVYTEVIFLKNEIPNKKHEITFKKAGKEDFNSPDFFQEKQFVFLKNVGYHIDIRALSKEGKLAFKIINKNKRLDELARASLGCQAYNSSKHSKAQIENRVFHSDTKISNEYLEELAGSDVGRYLLDRKKGQWIKYGPWLHDYRTMDWLQGPRVLVREITGKSPYKIQAVFTDETYCNYKTILNVNPSSKTKFSMKFLCGILNSKLLSFLFSYSSNKMEADSFPRMSVGDLKQLPIKEIDETNKSEKELHNDIVQLVETMLLLNGEKQQTSLPNKIEQLDTRIKYVDDKINKLVYQLYELNEEDIDIVEDK